MLVSKSCISMLPSGELNLCSRSCWAILCNKNAYNLQELWWELVPIMVGAVVILCSLMLGALERNKICSTVPTLAMVWPPAVILRMQVLAVQVYLHHDPMHAEHCITKFIIVVWNRLQLVFSLTENLDCSLAKCQYHWAHCTRKGTFTWDSTFYYILCT